jgi:23S rRNA (uracil1939-C5)-methyltransferase
MTRDAAAGAVAMKASRVVFVSCDVATLARDLRKFLDAGYRLDSVQGFDLFPNTAHVETLARLSLT